MCTRHVTGTPDTVDLQRKPPSQELYEGGFYPSYFSRAEGGGGGGGSDSPYIYPPLHGYTHAYIHSAPPFSNSVYGPAFQLAGAKSNFVCIHYYR